MKLVCGRTYRVTVGLHRGTYGYNTGVITSRLEYCGGGCVDKEGHWIGGGAWVQAGEFERKRNGCQCHQFFDLPILCIRDEREVQEQQKKQLLHTAVDSLAKRKSSSLTYKQIEILHDEAEGGHLYRNMLAAW